MFSIVSIISPYLCPSDIWQSLTLFADFLKLLPNKQTQFVLQTRSLSGAWYTLARLSPWNDSGGAWGEASGSRGGMHANVHADRNEWRLPPDETLQVADPKAKKAEVGDEEVSTPPPKRRTRTALVVTYSWWWWWCLVLRNAFSEGVVQETSSAGHLTNPCVKSDLVEWKCNAAFGLSVCDRYTQIRVHAHKITRFTY